MSNDYVEGTIATTSSAPPLRGMSYVSISRRGRNLLARNSFNCVLSNTALSRLGRNQRGDGTRFEPKVRPTAEG